MQLITVHGGGPERWGRGAEADDIPKPAAGHNTPPDRLSHRRQSALGLCAQLADN